MTFAIALIPFIGAAGLALDFGRNVVIRTALQSATDAAVLAGASVHNRTSNERLLTAFSVFHANQPDLPTQPVLTVTMGDDEITVAAETRANNPFMKALGVAITTIGTTSTAAFGVESGPCVLTLNKRSKEALMLNSDSRIEAPNCRVQVNSTSRKALFANSDSSINAESICVHGNWETNGSSSFSPGPKHCPDVTDPLAHLPPPPQAAGPCDWTDRTVKGRKTLSPGVYCKKLELDSGASVTFEPGIYVMRDGEFIVNSGSRAAGRDMMIYFEGSNNARFNINSGSRVEFRGRQTGLYAGLVFFQERGSRADYSILNSDSSSIIEGVIYLPSTALHLNSNGAVASASPWTAIITDKLELNSQSTMTINTNYAASQVPVPPGIGSGEGLGGTVLLKH